jgi:hypothetical protein
LQAGEDARGQHLGAERVGLELTEVHLETMSIGMCQAGWNVGAGRGGMR